MLKTKSHPCALKRPLAQNLIKIVTRVKNFTKRPTLIKKTLSPEVETTVKLQKAFFKMKTLSPEAETTVKLKKTLFKVKTLSPQGRNHRTPWKTYFFK